MEPPFRIFNSCIKRHLFVIVLDALYFQFFIINIFIFFTLATKKKTLKNPDYKLDSFYLKKQKYILKNVTILYLSIQYGDDVVKCMINEL